MSIPWVFFSVRTDQNTHVFDGLGVDGMAIIIHGELSGFSLQQIVGIFFRLR